MQQINYYDIIASIMENLMNNIFKPFSLNNVSVRNRLVAQAMEINSADAGGGVSEKILSRYNRLALGSWGIVFVEAISVTGTSLARKHGLVMSRENLSGFKRLIQEFKRNDDKALIMFQLTHAGRVAGDFSTKACIYRDSITDIPELTTADLDRIKNDFISACELAHEAGADGVDIKACHGYLLGEMLRPLNRRPDMYGGDARNRARLICDIVKEAKKNYPGLIIGSRISFYEGIRGGCGTSSADEVIEDPADIVKTTGFIVRAGVDYINVSAGIPSITPRLTRPGEDGLFNMYSHFRYAKILKENFPDTAIIGSAYSAGSSAATSFADENIGKGYTDLAGFGRQNLADPLLPLKLAEDPGSIKWCKLCGGCSKLLKSMKNVICLLERES
jgi:2,4-dienoyl-CoA reductase-like NADH-dependent reductase (Old Yellow Enzyme family)